MKKIALLLSAAIISISASALTVNSTAGALSSLIDDTSVTSLTVTGTIDARDIAFINTDLTALTALDLSSASIAEYSGESPVIGTVSQFDANVLPAFAFFNSNIAQISLPSSLKAIGTSALAACHNLEAITIPASVTTIGNNAFNSCTALKDVTIPETVTEIGTRVFAECDALTSATINSANTGEATFAGCDALTTVNIATNVQTIGSSAFAACSALSSLNIAENSQLKTIGDEAFISSAITTLNFNDLDNLTAIGRFAFANTNLTSIKFGDALQSLGDGAFFYNTALQQVQLPENVTEVGNYLLAGTNTVDGDSIILEGYTKVGDFAFYNWDQAVKFIVPKSVTYIGTQAMAGMTGLNSIVSHANEVPQLGDDVWKGVDQPSVTLYVDLSTINDYKDADQWQEFNIVANTGAIDVVPTQSVVNARFVGTTLVITATQPIAMLRLFEINGVLLKQITPQDLSVQIETADFLGNFYLVTMLMQNGETHSIKLVR